MQILDITDVAARTGLTARALRYYEARGLVRPVRADSGRRHYGPEQLARLHAVVALKRAGFSLTTIGHLLDGRSAHLGRLVASQLAEVDARAAELADTRSLLVSVQSRIDRGEPIDVATLCSLIRQGHTTMDQTNWKAVTDRFLSDAAKADFARTMPAACAGLDRETCAARWADLAGRIETALPLEPRSEPARALYAEWQALLAPFTAVATPAMMEGVSRMYDHIGEWQAEQSPPFSPRVWAFIKAVAAERATDA